MYLRVKDRLEFVRSIIILQLTHCFWILEFRQHNAILVPLYPDYTAMGGGQISEVASHENYLQGFV